MSSDTGHQQRDAVLQISPPWLSTGIAEKFLYNIGLSSDAVLEKLNQAMLARFPTRCDASALPLLGNDRVMGQGPGETNAQFGRRLKGAFDAWQRAGSRRSILQQVLAYVANTANAPATRVPVASIVGSSATGTYATWDVYSSADNTANPPHHQRVAPSNWNWDGSYQWWTSFLVLYFPLIASATTGTAASVTSLSGGFATLTGLSGMSAASVGQYLVVTGATNAANNGTFQISSFVSATSVKIANPSAVAGDSHNGAISWTLGNYPAVGPAPAFGTPGVNIGTNSAISVGLSVSSGFVAGLRSLVRLWKTANSFFPWFVVSFGGGDGTAGNEFSPLSAIGSGNPDGTWSTWAKTVNGVSVQARTTGVAIGKFDAFCDGTAVYQQCWTPTGS